MVRAYDDYGNVVDLVEHDAEIYNEAIDDFWKEFVQVFDDDECPNVSDYMDYKISLRKLDEICEQLRRGAENERML